MDFPPPDKSHPFFTMDRDRYARTVDFLLSGDLPGELIANKSRELLSDVLLVIRADIPLDMAITDPALYRSLRARVTELRIAGYF